MVQAYRVKESLNVQIDHPAATMSMSCFHNAARHRGLLVPDETHMSSRESPAHRSAQAPSTPLSVRFYLPVSVCQWGDSCHRLSRYARGAQAVLDTSLS